MAQKDICSNVSLYLLGSLSPWTSTTLLFCLCVPLTTHLVLKSSSSGATVQPHRIKGHLFVPNKHIPECLTILPLFLRGSFKSHSSFFSPECVSLLFQIVLISVIKCFLIVDHITLYSALII